MPLEMPKDRLTAQRWWLAFLAFARQTASAQLIEATLIQLDDENARHPEAELSRAALEALRGRPQVAHRIIENLRVAFPDEPTVRRWVAGFVKNYREIL